MVPEHMQCASIGWHCVVVEVAVDDVPQPFPLSGDRLVHAPPHFLFDHLELRSHAVPSGLPFDLEFSRTGFAAGAKSAAIASALGGMSGIDRLTGLDPDEVIE